MSVESVLRDPKSAEFDNLRVLVSPADPDDAIICGTVNAKNGFGGQSGPRRFVWRSKFDDPDKHPLHAAAGHLGLEEDEPKGVAYYTAVCDRVQASGS